MSKNTWTLEKLKKGVESFYKEYGHYPTALEIDAYPLLPSSRQIQRIFGGLVTMRQSLGLGGQNDFTKGQYSSERAHTIGKRAHKIEKELYDYLVGVFGNMRVHREFFFSDDKRNRVDFYIYDKNDKNFSIDIFYPANLRTLAGCLNSKMRTHRGVVLEYPVIFLVANPDLKEEDINKIVNNKKNKLHPNQKVMTMIQFKQYIRGRA